MANLIGILIFIIGIAVSIGLHEMGHLIPAKKFGVRVSHYMIGFGPTLWSRTRGETEYGLKAFPIGGYVRLVGMIPPADEVKPLRIRGGIARLIEDTRAQSVEEVLPGQEGRAFYRLSWWRRVIVMAGGPLANLLIAIVLFTGIGLFYGAATTVPIVSDLSECVLPQATVRECTSNDQVAPSVQAGIEVGDRIVAINGEAVEDWAAVTALLRPRPEEQVELTLSRDGAERTVFVVLATREIQVVDDVGEPILDADGQAQTQEVGFLGVSPTTAGVRQGPLWGTAIAFEYTGKTMQVMTRLPYFLWNAGEVLFAGGERDPNGIVSIVGAGKFAGDIAAAPDLTMRARLALFLSLVAGVNLALFVFNLIPLPPLDGGHIAGAVWQGIKNGWAKVRATARPRPVDLARLMPATYVMVVVLLAVGLLTIALDIKSPL